MRKVLMLGLGILVAAAASGCRGDDDDDMVDGGTTDGRVGDGSVARTTTIQKIQMGMEPQGAIVSVTGAVVTAQKTRTCGAGMCFDVWVQEPAGGMFSGVLLFGVPMSVASTLARGDEVSFTGEVDEFMAGGANPDIDSVTEIKVSSVTKTGSGKALVVSTVTPTMLGTKAMAEPWEGVLVKVQNFTVASVFRSNNVSESWNLWGGGLVDNELFDLPASVSSRDCVASAQGPLHYFYGYKIYPRDAADLVTTAGTGCPAFDLEFTMAECTDHMDNDFDGFADCAGATGLGMNVRAGDFSCDAFCSSTINMPMATSLSIQAMRAAVPATGTMVKLTDVVVTAVDTRVNAVSASAVNSIWVSDGPAATASTGVMIFQPNEANVASFSVGQRVTVYGKVAPFMATGGGSELELARDVLATVGSGTATPVPVVVTLTDANMEQYEGSLVTVAAVKAAAAPSMGETTLTPQAAGAGSIIMTDNFIDLASVAANTCFASVTGIIRHSRCGVTPTFTACYKLDATVLTTPTTCP